MFTSLLLLQSSIAFSMQMFNVGSAAIFYLTALSLFFSFVLNGFITNDPGAISLWTYSFAQATPLLIGTLIMSAICEVFVPLVSRCLISTRPSSVGEARLNGSLQTGRIGAEAPADHIIATIVSTIGAQALPLALPFAHRFGHRVLMRAVLLLGAITALMIVVFSLKAPFDQMHQKRVFVLHMENVRSIL